MYIFLQKWTSNTQPNALIDSEMNLDGQSVTKDLKAAIPDLDVYAESSPDFQELRYPPLKAPGHSPTKNRR